jgi:tetratricopeptide (TPR) repeat protein
MIFMKSMQSVPAIVGFICAMTFTPAASAAGPAKASEPARPTAPSRPEKTRRAATLYTDGVKAANEAKWPLAIQYFNASWQEYPHYQILMNLANAELMAKRYRDSAEHFDRALREYSSDLSPSDAAAIKEKLAEARSHVGTVAVEVNVRGAMLMIDQKAVDLSSASGSLFVDPGSRTVEARLLGYVPARESLHVRAGQTYRLSMNLTRPVASPAAETAPAEPSGSKRLARGLMIGGGVAAGLGAASGIVFSILSSVDAHRAEDAQSELDKDRDPFRANKMSECNDKNPLRDDRACEKLGLRERQQTFATIAGWSFIAGGVGLAAAAVGWRLGAAGDVRATVSASSSGGGFLVTGTW